MERQKSTCKRWPREGGCKVEVANQISEIKLQHCSKFEVKSNYNIVQNLRTNFSVERWNLWLYLKILRGTLTVLRGAT